MQLPGIEPPTTGGQVDALFHQAERSILREFLRGVLVLGTNHDNSGSLNSRELERASPTNAPFFEEFRAPFYAIPSRISHLESGPILRNPRIEIML